MLGADPLNSLSDTSDHAVMCLNLYPGARDVVLRSHPWNCAIKRVVLAPNATAPLFDYAYSFNLPADWLRTLSVGESSEGVDYVSEGRQLLSDESSLPLRYVFRNEDENTWHAGLVEAVTMAATRRSSARSRASVTNSVASIAGRRGASEFAYTSSLTAFERAYSRQTYEAELME